VGEVSWTTSICVPAASRKLAAAGISFGDAVEDPRDGEPMDGQLETPPLPADLDPSATADGRRGAGHVPVRRRIKDCT
jgi:hypothetical protein